MLETVFILRFIAVYCGLLRLIAVLETGARDARRSRLSPVRPCPPRRQAGGSAGPELPLFPPLPSYFNP